MSYGREDKVHAADKTRWIDSSEKTTYRELGSKFTLVDVCVSLSRGVPSSQGCPSVFFPNGDEIVYTDPAHPTVGDYQRKAA
jgi:hypothetical protein